MPSVTIGGTEPEAIVDVATGAGSSAGLGRATITVGATAANKQFGSGERLTVKRGGDVDFLGYTTARPARTTEGTLEIEAFDTRYELKKETVNRVFYNMDSGAIVRDLVERRATALDARTIHQGDVLDGWRSDAPRFSLCNITSRQLNDFGSDLLFVGFPADTEGSFAATYSDLEAGDVPGDGQLLSLASRLLVNDPGDHISVTVELCDTAGNSYVWRDIDTRTSFSTVELLAEEADADGDLPPGSFAYRFDLTGKLSDDIGIAIDHAAATPFALDGRDTEMTTNNVQDTGRTITRRTERGALELLQDLETEDGYTSYTDADNDLHYEPTGEGSQLSIVRGETRVTSASFPTDYDSIDNAVVVKGANEVQVSRRDPASIEYYGLSERTEPIVDREIQTESEAGDRASGYLDEHAWTDTVATFEIGDARFQGVRESQGIRVEWPPQGLSGTYTVESKQVDAAGIVTVAIGAQI